MQESLISMSIARDWAGFGVLMDLFRLFCKYYIFY